MHNNHMFAVLVRAHFAQFTANPTYFYVYTFYLLSLFIVTTAHLYV